MWVKFYNLWIAIIAKWFSSSNWFLSVFLICDVTNTTWIYRWYWGWWLTYTLLLKLYSFTFCMLSYTTSLFTTLLRMISSSLCDIFICSDRVISTSYSLSSILFLLKSSLKGALHNINLLLHHFCLLFLRVHQKLYELFLL